MPRSQNGQGDHVIWSEDVHIVGLYSVIVIGECKKTFKGCCIVQYSNFCQRPNPNPNSDLPMLDLSSRQTELSEWSIVTPLMKYACFSLFSKCSISYFLKSHPLNLTFSHRQMSMNQNGMKWHEVSLLLVYSIKTEILTTNKGIVYWNLTQSVVLFRSHSIISSYLNIIVNTYSLFCFLFTFSYHIICLVWRVTESSFDVSSIVLSTKSITTNFKSVLYFVWYPRLYLDFFIFLFNDVWRCDVKWNEMKWNEINSIEINSIEKAIILENIVLCEIFLRRMLSLT